MDAAENRITLEVHEPGFDGELSVDGRTLHVTGTRPQDGAAVVKDVPADRDPELARLVELVLVGDTDAVARALAHIGIVDPPTP